MIPLTMIGIALVVAVVLLMAARGRRDAWSRGHYRSSDGAMAFSDGGSSDCTADGGGGCDAGGGDGGGGGGD